MHQYIPLSLPMSTQPSSACLEMLATCCYCTDTCTFFDTQCRLYWHTGCTGKIVPRGLSRSARVDSCNIPCLFLGQTDRLSMVKREANHGCGVERPCQTGALCPCVCLRGVGGPTVLIRLAEGMVAGPCLRQPFAGHNAT